MLRLLLALVLLGVLAALEGASKTCPACSSLQNCTNISCPSAQDSCLFSQMHLENGTILESGSCVAPGGCQEGVYTLTYGPHSSLWVSTVCCENCSSPQKESGAKAQPNAVKCPYCSGDNSTSCDSLSFMNCTGNQTVCVTLNGTWSRGGSQILKGCATPEVCHLQVNDTLGPEQDEFHLTTKPDCNYLAPPTQPGPHANVTHSKAKATICFTCSDLYHCNPVSCPEDRYYCLQTTGITALGEGNSVAWRNGSCVASEDCKSGDASYAFTYGAGSGFRVSTTCCQGNCQEPPALATLLASSILSKFLCPTCAEGHQGPCNSSFYMQCPLGETKCVQLDLMPEEDSRNLSLSQRGCGSPSLCDARVKEGRLALPGLGLLLARPPYCSNGHRAILESQCLLSAAPGLRLALPALVVALGTSVLV